MVDTTTKTENGIVEIINIAPLLYGLSVFKKKGVELNQVKKAKIEAEIKSIINEEKVKTVNEEINGLAAMMANDLGIENDAGVKLEAKKIILKIEEWKKNNSKKAIDYKKEEFKKKFETELKTKNPEITIDQLTKGREYADLVADTYFEKSEIDEVKNEALNDNQKIFSPGKIENGWTDLQGMVSFLKKTPDQIKDFKQKYTSLKESLKEVQLPTNLRQVRSFENIASIFNNPNTDQLFSRTKKYLGWADNINNLTGGWLNKTVTDAGLKFAGKIGNQAIREFATNSLNVLAKEGFQKGFTTVMNGILSGGVKTAASGIATAGTTGAAVAGTAAVGATGAVAATGVGLPVAAVMALVQAAGFLKKKIEKVVEKLGISSKKFLEENFGKVGGRIVKGISSLISLISVPILSSAVTTGPLIIAIIGGIFVYQIITYNSISNLRPPKEHISENDLEIELPIENPVPIKGNYPGNLISTRAGKDGLVLYIFEPIGSDSRKITQLYDLAEVDSSYLVPVEKYYIYSGERLDSRVLEAFYKMYEAGQADGLDNKELKLVSGYRSNEEQTAIRNEWKEVIAENIYKDVYFGKKGTANWNCEFLRDSYYDAMTVEEKIEKCTTQYAALPGKSNHLTGRAVDLVVSDETTFSWLKNNGASYGFGYNYPPERWHWEYNPAP